MRTSTISWGAVALVMIATVPRPQADERPSSESGRLHYLERFYHHFAKEQPRPVIAMLPEDLSWHMIGWRDDVVPFAGVYTGPSRLRDLFADYFAAIEIREYQFEYALTDGPYTNWHFRLVANVPVTGKTFDAEFVHVWRFDERDRPVFVRAYYDTQLQVEAFSPDGPMALADRKDRADDHRVRATAHDVGQLVKTVYDRFYAGDIPGVLAMLSRDVSIYFQGKDNPQSGEYHGIDELLQFVQNLAGTALPGEIRRFQVSEGDRSDVVLFENWTVYATGKSYHVHTVNSWRVNEEGLLLGFINYPDVDAVAAAYVP